MDDAKDSVFEESSPVHSPFSPGHQGFGVPGLEFFSPRFQELLEDGAEAQRFLNFLSEFNADADAMFILQVDQIRELVDSPSKSTSNVFFDNVDRLYHKHISEDSKLPLTLISNRSLELLRRIMEEKTVTMNDLVVVQQKIKAKLDRDFVPKFLERKKDQPLVSALDVGNRNPSIQQVLHDVECMQLFILFLMKDMRHRMFLFWFELQQISSIHGTEGKESDIVRNEEFRKMASIYRKYVSKGDVSDTIGEIKYDHISSNLADTDTFELFKIKKLTATLSRMHKKVGKLLRLECWPQFCESELFKDLVKQRDENQKGALKSVSKSSSIHRMSLPSLFKKHVFSEDVVITSPKLDDFRRKLDIALKHAPELRYLEYVAVVRSAHVLPKKSSKVQETDFVREIVRQYPEKSRDDVPFPQHLPLFCFPEKHNIVTSRFKHVPAPPRLFNFIFSADQITFYGACLQISEIETGDSRFDSKSIDKRKREVGAMYAVVLLTRAPLVNTLRTILTDFSQCYNGGPIFECESFHKITSLLTTNWRPSKEMMNVYNLCSYKVSLDPQLLPSVDFELSALFKIMHPYKILSVLEYLVLEKKVLLVSSQLSVSIELLRTLVFFFIMN